MSDKVWAYHDYIGHEMTDVAYFLCFARCYCVDGSLDVGRSGLLGIWGDICIRLEDVDGVCFRCSFPYVYSMVHVLCCVRQYKRIEAVVNGRYYVAYPSLKYMPRSSFVMITSSSGNIFRVTGPLCGEFTGPGEFPTQRPVTRSFDVFFDLRLNKRLSKHSWGWWFATLSWSLWRHHNVINGLLLEESPTDWWFRHNGWVKRSFCTIIRLLVI